MIVSCYASLEEIKRDLFNIAPVNTDHDAVLLGLLQATSAQIDGWTGTHFYPLRAVRYFPRADLWYSSPDLLLEHELISVAGLSVDTNGSLLELAAGTDYRLTPYAGPPHKAIELPRGGQLGSWPYQRHTVAIDGVWGNGEQLLTLPATVAGALSDSAGTIPVSDGTVFERGSVIRLTPGAAGYEDVFVTAVEVNDLTVTRGVNGTTAVAHLDEAGVARVVYPPAVVRACLIQAERLFKRRETAFANVVASTDVGTFAIFRGLDPDVQSMLSPYRVPRVA